MKFKEQFAEMAKAVNNIYTLETHLLKVLNHILDQQQILGKAYLILLEDHKQLKTALDIPEPQIEEAQEDQTPES